MAMRVRVDPARCQGHTLCNLAAPALFSLREEDGHAVALVDEVPAEHNEAARRAAQGCPERAIELDES